MSSFTRKFVLAGALAAACAASAPALAQRHHHGGGHWHGDIQYGQGWNAGRWHGEFGFGQGWTDGPRVIALPAPRGE